MDLSDSRAVKKKGWASLLLTGQKAGGSLGKVGLSSPALLPHVVDNYVYTTYIYIYMYTCYVHMHIYVYIYK